MAEKDMISKEMEEQIQSLASDVYIQIEEKLTRLICATTPKEASEKINVAQDADSAKKFTQLEQEKKQLKQQLDDELAKQQENKQVFQVELAQNNSHYTETLERLEHENTLLKADLVAEQEQRLIERLDVVEKQRKNNAEESQKSAATWQKADQLQKSALIEQKKQITELNELLKASASESPLNQEKYNSQIDKSKKEFEQKIAQMNKQLQQAQSEANEQKKTLIEQEQAQAVSQQKITQLEKKNQELAGNLITEQSDLKLYQKEVESLKSQVKLAEEGQKNVLNRFNANRAKQEKDNDQVRETIKYLRDENSEMISQYNNKKAQFLEQIHELESKLTEYRLKFEYAQKQLTKNSER